MLNECNAEGIFSIALMKDRYDIEYPIYEPDAELLMQLKAQLVNKRILIFLGTWCGDSQKQLPRFYKILDALQLDRNLPTLICVDEMKKDEKGLTETMGIVSVPTFIFLENEQELGRITESPIGTLESDMIEILTKK